MAPIFSPNRKSRWAVSWSRFLRKIQTRHISSGDNESGPPPTFDGLRDESFAHPVDGGLTDKPLTLHVDDELRDKPLAHEHRKRSLLESDPYATVIDSSLPSQSVDETRGASRHHLPPLKDASTQIRLVRFTPSPATSSKLEPNEEEMISIKVETFNLSDMRDKFTAISYTWGPKENKRPIIINHKPILVSKKLCEVLRRISKEAVRRDNHNSTVQHCDIPIVSASSLFWIDQICIDQAHTNERNHQVKLMSSIYAGAVMVVIVLGEQRQPRRLFDLLGLIGGVEDILRDQYWTRLWIIQEIMLAKSLRLLHGSDLWDWASMRQLAKQSSHITPPNIVDRKLIPGLMTDRFALHRALELFSAQNCHDPRDKVYGLMGVVHKKERIEIDYNKGAPEIYWDAIAGLRTRELRDPDRIIQLGREMNVTGEEEFEEGVLERFLSLFGGKHPREVFQGT